MKWKKYTIYTTTEAEDIISAMLNELGVEGVQIEDNIPLSEEDTKGMFIDILPELPPDDGTSRVSFFLREPEDEAERRQALAAAELRRQQENGPADANGAPEGENPSVDGSYTVKDRIWLPEEIADLLETVRQELSEMRAYTDIGEGRIEEGETQDTDWMNSWKQYFRPFLVENLLIKPTWEEIPEEYREAVERQEIMVLEMDPGAAFGTGSHETTQLCLRMLKKYLQGGEQVLDIGTGSGILGIAALKLGASQVTATDLDEACLEAVAENLAANEIPEDRFRLLIGNVLGDQATEDAVGYGCYDLMLANILAPVIVLLAGPGAADRHIRQGGIFITSGIIDTREAEVLEAFSQNPAWEVLEVNHQGEWVNVTARRREGGGRAGGGARDCRPEMESMEGSGRCILQEALRKRSIFTP